MFILVVIKLIVDFETPPIIEGVSFYLEKVLYDRSRIVDLSTIHERLGFSSVHEQPDNAARNTKLVR
jgi:hypothetical protein